MVRARLTRWTGVAAAALGAAACTPAHEPFRGPRTLPFGARGDDRILRVAPAA